MANKLVIVESPSKSKTIGNYLGKDYVVTSSKDTFVIWQRPEKVG